LRAGAGLIDNAEEGLFDDIGAQRQPVDHSRIADALGSKEADAASAEDVVQCQSGLGQRSSGLEPALGLNLSPQREEIKTRYASEGVRENTAATEAHVFEAGEQTALEVPVAVH